MLVSYHDVDAQTIVGILYVLSAQKIKTAPTSRLALFCTALVAAGFMLSDSASAVSIRDAHELGLVQFGASSRHSDGSTYINNFIGMALPSKRNGQQAVLAFR